MKVDFKKGGIDCEELNSMSTFAQRILILSDLV